MYLLLGLLYVVLVVFEATRGPKPAVEEHPPEAAQGISQEAS
jgi:hypothetical protein